MKLLMVLAAASMLSGCRFWYKPVPVENAVGEEQTVLSGDTVNVYRDRAGRFEVYGPSSEIVFDGYEQVNRAYRAFERYFGAPAPRLAVVMYRDSIVPLDAAAQRSLRDRGYVIMPYLRPPAVRSRRSYSAIDYGGVTWPVAPMAARTMLARFADAQLGGGPRSDNELLDRFPLWYRAAVIHLVGEAGAMEHDLAHVREKRSVLLPLKDLIVNVRPSSADSLLDPSLRAESDEISLTLAAQSATLARFLVEREGPAVLGRLARGYLANRSITDMVAEFHSAPRNVAELERRWLMWVDTHQDY